MLIWKKYGQVSGRVKLLVSRYSTRSLSVINWSGAWAGTHATSKTSTCTVVSRRALSYETVGYSTSAIRAIRVDVPLWRALQRPKSNPCREGFGIAAWVFRWCVCASRASMRVKCHCWLTLRQRCSSNTANVCLLDKYCHFVTRIV